jgi:hypothetical protein
MVSFALSDRSSVFRFDISSDKILFLIDKKQTWGGGFVEGKAGNPRLCSKVDQIDIPADVSVEIRRFDIRSAVDLQGDEAGRAITLHCSDGLPMRTAFVSLPVKRATAPQATSIAPLSERGFLSGINGMIDSRRPQLVVRVAGRELRIGDGPDPNSPLSSSAILRNGTLSSETDSWPVKSSIISTEYVLHPGDIISFDRPSSGPASEATSGAAYSQVPAEGRGSNAPKSGGTVFSGLLLIDADNVRIVGDARSKAAYVTPPGSLRGAPRIVAPTVLARLEAQSEWGVMVVLGILLLNLLTALEQRLIEDKEEELFEWAKRRTPDIGLDLP